MGDFVLYLVFLELVPFYGYWMFLLGEYLENEFNGIFEYF